MTRRTIALTATVPLSVLRQRKPLRLPLTALPWLLIGGDILVAISAALVAEAGYRTLMDQGAADMQRSLGLGVAAAFLFVTLQQSQGLYRGMRSIRLLRQFRSALVSWMLVFAILAALLFLFKIGDTFSRVVMVSFMCVGYAGLVAWRIIVRRLCLRLVTAGTIVGPRAALLVEHGFVDVAAQMNRLRRAGYRLTRIFMLPDGSEDAQAAALTEAALGGLVRHVREQQVDEILVLGSWGGAIEGSDIMTALRMVPAPVKLIADQPLSRILAHPSCEVAGSRAMLLKPSPLGLLQRAGKRAFDIVAASILLIALSPLLAVAALSIKLDSPGPVLFRQWRGGFNGRRFRIWKLRTMHVAEEGADVRQAKRGDARVTRVGRWLRASSIDELPQLLNVLKGDMSIVGPRPHAIVHDKTYAALIAPYPARHNMKPGITGWAQVQGCRGETSDAAHMQRRVAYDLSYIENWSFLLDLLIIGMTVREVLRPRNAY